MSIYRVDGDSLIDVADAIRAKTGGSFDLEFPDEFISEIGSIQTGGTLPDGMKDCSFDYSGWAIGNISNNVVTLSTTSSYTSCFFPFNNAIHVSSGDVILMRFTKQGGTSSYSDLRIMAIGRLIDSNVNTNFNSNVNDKTYTATYDFDMAGLYFGSRLGNWDNAKYLIELFINNVQIF